MQQNKWRNEMGFADKYKEAKRDGLKARSGGGHGFFPDGFDGLVEVQNVSVSKRKKAFVVECKIIEAEDKDLEGKMRTWICPDNEYQAQNVIEFLVASCGEDPSNEEAVQHIPEDMYLACQNDELYGKTYASAVKNDKGKPVAKLEPQRRVRLRVRTKDTKAGGRFSRHLWDPADAA